MEIYFENYVSSNHVLGAINVHFVINSAAWTGAGVFPWQNNNFSCAVITSGYSSGYTPSIEFTGSTLAHEIGHTLGLYHTFETVRSSENFNESAGNCYQEAVSRSKRQGVFCVSTIDQLKCEINGDALCDTQADPAIQRPNRFPYSYLYPNSCTYNSSIGGTDNWNATWTPTVANIMGYVPYNCRSYFSPLQVAKMYGYIDDIGISYPTLNISGPNNLCAGNTATYSVPYQSGVTFFWEMPYNMNLLSGQGTNTVLVQSGGNYGGVIQVTPSCGNRTAKKTILNIQEPPIDGYDQACPLFTYTYTTPYISNADYEWSVTNGYVVSGQYTNQVQIALTQSSSHQTIIDLELSGVCTYSVYGQKIVTHGDPPPPEQQCYAVGNKTLGIVENVKFDMADNMLIYPNPASDIVTVIPTNREKYILMIFNSIGQTLFKKTMDVQDKYSIDVRNFPDGIYYVKLIGQKSSFTKKIILKK